MSNSTTDPATDPAFAAIAVYGEARDHLISQVRNLSIEQLNTKVPTCPLWSVADVVAHTTGLVTDLLSGMQPPFGTDEMTSRQVTTRSDMSIDEVCDEWAANATGIAEVMAGAPLVALGFTGDLAVHTYDIAEAVDTQPPPPSATATGCERYVPLLQERVADRLGIALTVTLEDRVWLPATGAAPVAMSGTASNFLLSVTGRRIRSQVEGFFAWDGDPTAILDGAFTQYGPYRES